MERDREELLASLVAEFDEIYKRYEGSISDEEIIERFLAKHPELEPELKEPLLEEIKFSIFLWKTLSFRPMPEEASKRVWAKIEEKLREMKKEKEEDERVIPLNKRPDFLILLLYAPGRRRMAEGIRGITRIMKYLFLLAKEKEVGRYVEDYYSFAPRNLGPFDKRLYDDLESLRGYGLIEKVPVLRARASPEERDIADFFERGDWNTEYRLTEKGVKFAKALVRGANEKDKNIMKAIEEIKAKYSRYPLLKLLEYIYEKYPEYQENSIIWEKIKKGRESENQTTAIY